MQTEKSRNFLLLLIGIIIVSFVILQPKISTWLLPLKRQIIWQGFINEVQKNKKIDAKKFWEFREFYNPGSFIFERDGLSKKQTSDQFKELGVSFTGAVALPFLIYDSGKMQSMELLVVNKDLNQLLENLNTGKNIIYKDDSSVIYHNADKTAEIIFIKPTEEMVTANGFFNYRNKDDVKVYKDRYWLSISRIEL